MKLQDALKSFFVENLLFKDICYSGMYKAIQKDLIRTILGHERSCLAKKSILNGYVNKLYRTVAPNLCIVVRYGRYSRRFVL
jgi:hypothetical protein